MLTTNYSANYDYANYKTTTTANSRRYCDWMGQHTDEAENIKKFMWWQKRCTGSICYVKFSQRLCWYPNTSPSMLTMVIKNKWPAANLEISARIAVAVFGIVAIHSSPGDDATPSGYWPLSTHVAGRPWPPSWRRGPCVERSRLSFSLSLGCVNMTGRRAEGWPPRQSISVGRKLQHNCSGHRAKGSRNISWSFSPNLVCVCNSFSFLTLCVFFA